VEEVRLLSRRYGAVLLDLDGTVYMSTAPADGMDVLVDLLPGAKEFIAACRDAGVLVGFATNTSYQTPEVIAARLRRAGIPAEPGEVLTAPGSIARQLLADGVRETAYLGGPGVRAAVAAAGIPVVGVDEVDPEAWADGGGPRAIAVGADPELRLATLNRAAELVDTGARLYVSTLEPHFPSAVGRQPGSGPIVAAIAAMARDRLEPVVCGKPSEFYAALAAQYVAGREPVLMVGDNPATDIAMAELLGWDSLLVLTGTTTAADLKGATAHPRATFVVPDLTAALSTPADLP
jgi:glycerol-1-phosphatase